MTERKAKVESFEDLESSSGPIACRLTSIGEVLPCRGSNNRRWAIRSGGRASRFARMSPKVTAGKIARKHKFRRFLAMAIGSADEMRVRARYAFDLGYLDDATWRRWRDEYQTIARMLQSLASRLG
jgi:hypothetical protein